MKEKIKTQKGFIKNSILILIIVLIFGIVGVGYFGFKQYQNYQNQIAKSLEIAEQKRNVEEEAGNIEMKKLQEEIESLKNKKPEVIIQEVNTKEVDLVSVIEHWRPVVAYIECEFKDINKMTYEKSGGSGVVIRGSSANGTFILSNKHVLYSETGNVASVCYVKFPGSNNVYTFSYTSPGSGNPFRHSDYGYDWGIIMINSPDNYINSITSPDFSLCDNKASLGDEVVIFGYPGIGSYSGVTVTKGIVSGQDGYYYITDAKIDYGNSGGAAILLKENCYLGIPSFVVAGSLESLARILDIDVIFQSPK